MLLHDFGLDPGHFDQINSTVLHDRRSVSRLHDSPGLDDRITNEMAWMRNKIIRSQRRTVGSCNIGVITFAVGADRQGRPRTALLPAAAEQAVRRPVPQRRTGNRIPPRLDRRPPRGRPPVRQHTRRRARRTAGDHAVSTLLQVVQHESTTFVAPIRAVVIDDHPVEALRRLLAEAGWVIELPAEVDDLVTAWNAVLAVVERPGNARRADQPGRASSTSSTPSRRRSTASAASSMRSPR